MGAICYTLRRAWLRIASSQTGSSLIELVAGGAIALIALGLIIQLQISGYRYQQNDEERFTVQVESANAMDLLVRDLRMSSSVTGLTPGSSSITLTVGGSSVLYTHRPTTGEVVRTENGRETVVGRKVELLAFSPTEAGRAVRVEWLARLPDGTTYLLVGKASPRVSILAGS